jgi:diguanylate cyclase (GGDEF)-like protein
MDYSRYDKDIQNVINDCVSMVAAGDAGALDAIAKLRGIASEKGDDALLGIADYCACNWYYDQSDYDNYQKHIKKAIQHFLRGNNAEFLARAYNFFAADAHDNDAFDVAYHYFHSALQFADEKKAPVTAGVVYANLARLYYDIEDYKLARQYFRKGFKLISYNTNDVYYHYNVMAGIVNDGLTLLQMGKNDLAEKAYNRAQKEWKHIEDVQHRELLMTFKVLEARLAMVKGEEDKFKSLMSEMVADLKEDEHPYSLMGEIRDFCRVLIATGRTDYALALIEAIDDCIISSGVTHAIRHLYEVKVDLYDAIGNEKKLDESLREQHRLLERQNEERKKLYQYSTELIDLIGELQEEEARVRAENENLQLRIITDPLTGIPNRYAMDVEVSKRYEKAYKGKSSLGVEIMDVDGFKAYNDNYGHQAGDRCLEKIGEVLRSICDKYNLFCARYGGDEFMMIYEGMNDEEIRRISGEIGEAISRIEVETDGKVIDRKVTISQGICNDVPKFKTKPWDYLSEADAALYVVKGKSVNKIRIHKLPEFTA